VLTITGSGAGLSRSTFVSLSVTNGAPTISLGPTSSLYAVSHPGTTTVPVRTRWAACDPDGLGSYRLQRKVNGGSWSTVSLSSATATAIKQALTKGTSYRYRLRATDQLGAVSGYVYGPSFKPIMTDQDSSAVTWSGTWHTVSLSGTYGGTTRYSGSAGASASFTFTGSSIAWVSYRGPNRGSATVYVDGTYVTTVNLNASSNSSRRIVWTRNFAAMGTRTVKIVVVGTAGHPRVDVDAFARLYRT
jgi:hypothetical protein